MIVQPRQHMVTSSEERRLVTALFCDLVGFTPLTEQLDPEDVREIQAMYFGRMAKQAARYGGTVEKYAGDAVLVLFGAPLAHEDDPERAVLCALAMRKEFEAVAAMVRGRWQVDVAIRIGVMTGEVVSGTWDASGRQDVAVTGDALNTAARLQAAAQPGGVLVGAETMQLSRRRVRYGPRQELTLKGKSVPVPAWAPLGLRDEVEERWEHFAAPLVGRAEELRQLTDLWRSALAGTGGLAIVTGEPGVGKSRLVAEAMTLFTAGDSGARTIRGRALSYGQQISLWLVADLVRSLIGVPESASPEEIRRALSTEVEDLLHTDEEARHEAVDLLGEVLGLPAGGSILANAGPEIRRRGLIRSFQALLAALASRCPTIIVLEDCHWLDPASEEVLKGALDHVPSLRCVVLATQRTERPPWWAESDWARWMRLDALAQDDAAVLGAAVLGHATISDEVERYVAERAEGNPFYVEELLRALREAGGLEQRAGALHLVPGVAEKLPTTLIGILLARLDRLEAGARQLAQVGSVIGRSFAVRVLAVVMQEAEAALHQPLSRLEEADIASPRVSAELEYVFKHALTREAAYHALIRRRRRELHLAVANAIAELYPGDDFVEMIAYHSVQADAPDAAEWLERAGDRAARTYSTETALAHYADARRRLEAAGAHPADLARLGAKLGSVLLNRGRYHEALAELEPAAMAYRSLGQLEAAGRVAEHIGNVHYYGATPETGMAALQPMIDVLQAAGPSESLVRVRLRQTTLLWQVGRYREALGEALRAVNDARTLGDTLLIALAEEREALLLANLGRCEEAAELLERVIPEIEAAGDLFTLTYAVGNAGSCSHALGRVTEGDRYFARGLELCERVGNPEQLVAALLAFGGSRIRIGDWATARQQLTRAQRLVGRERNAYAAWPVAALADLESLEGNWDEAERLYQKALAMSEEIHDRQLIEDVRAGLAELYLRRDRPDEARRMIADTACADDAPTDLRSLLAWAELKMGNPGLARTTADDAVRRARETGEMLALQFALWVLGMVLTSLKRWEEAKRALVQSRELARSLNSPFAEGDVLHALGLLHAARGNETAARRSLNQARAIFRRLGAHGAEQLTEAASLALSRADG